MNGREQESVKGRRRQKGKKEQKSPENLCLRSATKQNESFTNAQKNITFRNCLIWRTKFTHCSKI